MHPLHVVTMVSNPIRFRSRYNLYKNFEKQVKDAGANLWTVEVAFGERPFAVTQADNPYDIQLRTDHELWHKENALNIGVQHLSRHVPDWKYVAWIDADVSFARPDWVEETVHQLQHHRIVQLFSQAVDLDPVHHPIQKFYHAEGNVDVFSWAYCNMHDMKSPSTSLKNFIDKKDGDSCYGRGNKFYWHPGFAWAMRRKTWDDLGGLIDYSILGAADHLMAACWTGHLDLSPWFSEGYKRRLLEYKHRSDMYVRRDLGYVPGLLKHHWHGKKAQRGYKDRWKIFRDNKFDPDFDIKRDAYGLFSLQDRMEDRSISLRDDIRRYFRCRNEDSIDVE